MAPLTVFPLTAKSKRPDTVAFGPPFLGPLLKVSEIVTSSLGRGAAGVRVIA